MPIIKLGQYFLTSHIFSELSSGCVHKYVVTEVRGHLNELSH